MLSTYDWTATTLIDATAPTSVVWYTALQTTDGTPEDMINNRGQCNLYCKPIKP